VVKNSCRPARPIFPHLPAKTLSSNRINALPRAHAAAAPERILPPPGYVVACTRASEETRARNLREIMQWVYVERERVLAVFIDRVVTNPLCQMKINQKHKIQIGFRLLYGRGAFCFL
jgi:hypothetical protein